MPTRFSYAPIDPGYGEMGRAIAGGITGGIDRFQAGREATRQQKLEEEARMREQLLQEMEWRTRGISDRAPVDQHDFRQDPYGVQIGGELAALSGSLPGGEPSPISRAIDPSGMIGGYTEPATGRVSPETAMETGNIASGMVNTMQPRTLPGTTRFERTRPEEGVFELGPNPFNPEEGLYMRDREDITRIRAMADADRQMAERLKLLEAEYALKRRYPNATEQRLERDQATFDATNEVMQTLQEAGARGWTQGDERVNTITTAIIAKYPTADPSRVLRGVNLQAQSAFGWAMPGFYDAQTALTAGTTAAGLSAREPYNEAERQRERQQAFEGDIGKVLTPTSDVVARMSLWRMKNPKATPEQVQTAVNEFMTASMPAIRALVAKYQDLGVTEQDVVSRIRTSLTGK